MSEPLCDISGDLDRLAKLSGFSETSILAPQSIRDWIRDFVQSHSSTEHTPPPQRSLRSTQPNRGGLKFWTFALIKNSQCSDAQHSADSHHDMEWSYSEGSEHQITRESVLSKLHTYESTGFYLEYPETSEKGVGDLIRRDPQNWINPLLDLAYSKVKPGGQTVKGKEKPFRLLVHPTDPDIQIPCIKIHSSFSPQRDIFSKTAAFIAGIRTLGCGSHEADLVPDLPPSEDHQRLFLDQHQKTLQRGYVPLKPACSGRFSLDYDRQGK
ncbi:hypothetical protein B0H13DRAFT_1859042 [Mycena leptocephala]|nr:hypothetical protein B0H13DRAFT_1859042 [Mycena leptocephala]